MGMELFGQTFTSPVMLCPVGSQRAFHAEGELAVARAAQARGQLQILSTQSSTPIEDVAKARGGSGLWYQLYTTNNWDVTTKLLKRAEAAGCPVVAVTVDLPGGPQYRDRPANGASRYARLRHLSRRGWPGELTDAPPASSRCSRAST